MDKLSSIVDDIKKIGWDNLEPKKEDVNRIKLILSRPTKQTNWGKFISELFIRYWTKGGECAEPNTD